MIKIMGESSRDIFYYDEENMTISDKEGNVIKLYEPLDGVIESNLSFYLSHMFHKIYLAQNEFKVLCRNDKRDGFIWEKM